MRVGFIRLALALALALGGCGRPASPPPDRTTEPDRSRDGGGAGLRQSVDRLLDLMRQRLLVQHEVARSKWHARLPITDPKREQELLDRAEAQARGLGLEAGLTRAFFRAQMRAGKLVQQADFDAWQRGEAAPPAAGPDLKALRVEIDRLNRKLMEALKEAGPGLMAEAGRRAVRARAEVVVQGRGITAQVRQAACVPLLGP
jgi:chorismate mutase